MIAEHKEILSEIQTRIEKVLNSFKSCVEAKMAFDVLFENISKKCQDQSQKLYNINKILRTHPKAVCVRKYVESQTAVLVDFMPYKKAVGGIILIFNGFMGEDLLPEIMEIYAITDQMLKKLKLD